ncbi:HAD family hydrolase [Mycoplasma sp. 394]
MQLRFYFKDLSSITENKLSKIQIQCEDFAKFNYINKVICLFNANNEILTKIHSIQLNKENIYDLKVMKIKFNLNDIDTFVFDLDGTLLTSDFKLLDAQLNALKYLESKNKNIIIATGRPKFTIQSFIHHIPTQFPLILANGSMIYDLKNDKLVKSFDILKEDAFDLYDKLIELNFDFLFYTKDKMVAYNTHLSDFYIKKNYPSRVKKGRYIEAKVDLKQYNWQYFKFLVVRRQNDEEMFIELKEYLKNKANITGVVSQKQFFDITSKFATKGNALKWLLDKYNLDANKTMVFGDAENDISMFEVVRYSATTANSFEIVKNKVHMHLQSNDVAWLAEFIKKDT